MSKRDFILASASPQRKLLLEQIGFEPIKIESADIDESIMKDEGATAYVKRMAYEKALKVYQNNTGNIVLGSDTTVVVGRKIITKACNNQEQEAVMHLLSGKSHRVITAVCVINKSGNPSTRVVSTRILMKRLSEQEIKDYVASKEWVGCAGYKIEGCLSGFVKKIIGSYSGVVGLPLFETRNMLIGAGVK